LFFLVSLRFQEAGIIAIPKACASVLLPFHDEMIKY
jgi:hypothetical protein